MRSPYNSCGRLGTVLYKKVWLSWALIPLLCGCKPHARAGHSNAESSDTTSGSEESVSVDMPASNPAERDDPNAPMLRVELKGPEAQPIPVPYLYGYPLYAEGSAIEGLRMLRQENWAGYARQEHKQ